MNGSQYLHNTTRQTKAVMNGNSSKKDLRFGKRKKNLVNKCSHKHTEDDAACKRHSWIILIIIGNLQPTFCLKRDWKV